MNEVHLASFDMSSLLALQALLAEGSVTRASRRMGITQSAMSHALARLRTLLEDPLFVRTPRGMLPTARAKQLEGPLRRALADIERALAQPAELDPKTERRTFTIAALDYIELLLLPPLLARLAKDAPNVNLVVRIHRDDSAEQLERDTLDLCLGVVEEHRPDIRRQRLFEERFVCIVRKDHPKVRRALTLDHYC